MGPTGLEGSCSCRGEQEGGKREWESRGQAGRKALAVEEGGVE